MVVVVARVGRKEVEVVMGGDSRMAGDGKLKCLRWDRVQLCRVRNVAKRTQMRAKGRGGRKCESRELGTARYNVHEGWSLPRGWEVGLDAAVGPQWVVGSVERRALRWQRRGFKRWSNEVCGLGLEGTVSDLDASGNVAKGGKVVVSKTSRMAKGSGRMLTSA